MIIFKFFPIRETVWDVFLSVFLLVCLFRLILITSLLDNFLFYRTARGDNSGTALSFTTYHDSALVTKAEEQLAKELGEKLAKILMGNGTFHY